MLDLQTMREANTRAAAIMQRNGGRVPALARCLHNLQDETTREAERSARLMALARKRFQTRAGWTLVSLVALFYVLLIAACATGMVR